MFNVRHQFLSSQPFMHCYLVIYLLTIISCLPCVLPLTKIYFSLPYSFFSSSFLDSLFLSQHSCHTIPSPSPQRLLPLSLCFISIFFFHALTPLLPRPASPPLPFPGVLHFPSLVLPLLRLPSPSPRPPPFLPASVTQSVIVPLLFVIAGLILVIYSRILKVIEHALGMAFLFLHVQVYYTLHNSFTGSRMAPISKLDPIGRVLWRLAFIFDTRWRLIL